MLGWLSSGNGPNWRSLSVVWCLSEVVRAETARTTTPPTKLGVSPAAHTPPVARQHVHLTIKVCRCLAGQKLIKHRDSQGKTLSKASVKNVNGKISHAWPGFTTEPFIRSPALPQRPINILHENGIVTEPLQSIRNKPSAVRG